MLLDQHLVFVVYLYLFQLAYNAFGNEDNLVNSQLRNHLPDQLQSFECYHMLFDHFLLVIKEENIPCVLLYQSYLLPENLDQLSNLNTYFVLAVILDLYLFQLIILLKPDPSYFNSFVLSWVDKVTTRT